MFTTTVCCATLGAALSLQRWFRRSIPVRRARIRAARVRRVVKAAIDIQRVWKGYRQRQRTKDYLRVRRWARQVKELRALLSSTGTAEGMRVLALVEVDAADAKHDSDEDEGDVVVDPIADAKYFRSLRTMPKWERGVNRAVRAAETHRFTTSMAIINRDCDAAEKEFDAALKVQERRRIRSALNESASRRQQQSQSLPKARRKV